MGTRRFELQTSSLSGTRSNQLSYAPELSTRESHSRLPLSILAPILLTESKPVKPIIVVELVHSQEPVNEVQGSRKSAGKVHAIGKIDANYHVELPAETEK